MSQNARLIVIMSIWMVALCILLAGGFTFDWPWHSLWTNPGAIHWTHVLLVVGILAVAGLATGAIWRVGSSEDGVADEPEPRG